MYGILPDRKGRATIAACAATDDRFDVGIEHVAPRLVTQRWFVAPEVVATQGQHRKHVAVQAGFEFSALLAAEVFPRPALDRVVLFPDAPADQRPIGM
jgi:hypothetical protein